MKLLEVVYRIWIQDSFYNMMSHYHLEQARKYISNDSMVDKWRYHSLKVLYWDEKFWRNQPRINELKAYFEGLN